MKRKLLFLLCALLTSVGMWAYTTTDLTNAGWTKITSSSITDVDNNFYVLVDANSSNYVVSCDATEFRPCYKTINDPVGNPSFVWVLDGDDNKFSMQSVATGAFFKQVSGWNTSMGYARDDGREVVTGEFTLSSGKYTLKCTQVTGNNNFIGHWNDDGAAVKEDGEDIAANKSSANAPGFYLYSIPRTQYLSSLITSRKTPVSTATRESPADVTSWIQNADWSGDWGGWESTITSSGNMQWGQKTIESWNANNVILKQDLVVPNGLYKFTGDVISGPGATKAAYLYATGDEKVSSSVVSAEASANNYTTMSNEVAGNTLTADNVLVSGNSITVGVDQSTGWIVADNFKLYYYGNAISYYDPDDFTSNSSATASTWYAFTVESAGWYRINSSAAATLYYSQDDSDDADGTASKGFAEGGYAFMNLSVGTFYFKASATSTIKIEAVGSGVLQNGDVVTDIFISNPSFEVNGLANWTNGGGFDIESGENLSNKNGTNYAHINNHNSRSLSQAVEGLVAGNYILSVNARMASASGESGTATVKIGDNNATLIPCGLAAATYTVAYEAAANASTTIAYSKNGSYSNHYFDNFILTYYSTLPDVVGVDALLAEPMAGDVRAALEVANTAYTGSKTAANYNALQTAIVNAKVSIADFAGRTSADADWTGVIQNPSFETGNTTGWTYTASIDHGAKRNDNATYTMSDVDGNYLFNIWSTGNPISQTLKNLPAGTYKLTAVMGTDADKTFYLKMGDETGYATSVNKGTGVTVTVYTKLTAKGDLTISADAGGSQWYKVDNFRLTYNPTLPAELTAVEGKMNATVATAQTTAVNAYNATSGQTIDNLITAQTAMLAAYESKLVYNDITTIKNTYDAKAANLDDAGQAAYKTATETATTGAETMYSAGTYTTAAEAEEAYSRDYTTAVKGQTTPGTDLSELITDSRLSNNVNTEFYNTTGDVNQTITGLSTGYYLITAQAYYRAGGGETERTEQNAKLYGKMTTGDPTEIDVVNINSYTAEKDYPSTGNWSYVSSIKSYVPNNTNAGIYAFGTLDAYHNAVAVNVTDGTLQLGIKKSTTIEYDWTFWNNFKLYYLGTSLPASLTAATGDMNATVASAQTTAVGAYNAESGQTVANYNTAKNAIIAAEASISLYDKISDDIDAYDAKVATTLDDAGQAAYDKSSVTSKYSAGSYISLGEVDEELAAAYIAAVKSQGAGSDWTALITNPSFEAGVDGWTCSNVTSGPNHEKDEHVASDGTWYVGFWKQNYTVGSSTPLDIHQSVTLPAGFYRVEFDAFNHNGSTHTWKEAQLYFGTTESSGLPYDDNYLSWRTFGFVFNVATETTANLGARFTPNGDGDIWEHVDNFRLTYLGDASANLKVNDGKLGTFIAPFAITLPTGVKAYSATSDAEKVILAKIAEGGGTLAAGTPVIIYGDGVSVNETFYGDATVTGNQTADALVGILDNSNKIVPKDAYVLQTQTIEDVETQSFYKLASAATGALNRCYVIAESGVTTARLTISIDEETAINAIEEADVKTDSQKDGKFFVGGKIVIVRNGVKYGVNGQKLN